MLASAKHARVYLLSTMWESLCIADCVCASRPTLYLAKAAKERCCLAQGPVAYFLPLTLTREVLVPTVNHLPNPGQDVCRQACILKPNPQCICYSAAMLKSDLSDPLPPSSGCYTKLEV